MDSFSSQPLVEHASSIILDIIKTKVLRPVPKDASQVDVWHDAIDDIREQLEIIRPMASMAQEVPLYAVAADIQLTGWHISKGWPSWSAIVGLDVSGNPDHPWLAMGGQVPTQRKPLSHEDISMEEVPIVATKHVRGDKEPVDRKGKGKQKEVTTREDSVELDQLGSDIEVEEPSPPPKRTVPPKAPKRGRSRAPSRAGTAMPEEREQASVDNAEPVSTGRCATCAQRDTVCTSRPGKACLECNTRKVKCSWAPPRGRSVTRSQPPPPPSTKPAEPAASSQPTEDSSQPLKDSRDSSKTRSKRRHHRSRQPTSPDVLQAPLKLKIPQSKKRARDSSPSVERQTRKAKTFDAVVITKAPPGGPSKSSNKPSVSSAEMTALREQVSDMALTLASLGKVMQTLVNDVQRLSGDKTQGNLEPGSGDASSRTSAEGSGLSLPPSSSVPTTALDPSPNSSAPSRPSSVSLPPSGSVPTSALLPSPISSAPPPPPSALLATSSMEGPPPPSSAPISPLEAPNSVPEIVVSLPDTNASASASAMSASWNAGFTFGTYRPAPLFGSQQGINETGTKPTDASMEE